MSCHCRTSGIPEMILETLSLIPSGALSSRTSIDLLPRLMLMNITITATIKAAMESA
jgi:hypothetical protein